jgi:hypothetical protein
VAALSPDAEAESEAESDAEAASDEEPLLAFACASALWSLADVASILGLKNSMNISTMMAHIATRPMAMPVALRRIVSPGVRGQTYRLVCVL